MTLAARPLRIRDAVFLRSPAELERLRWPEACVPIGHVLDVAGSVTREAATVLMVARLGAFIFEDAAAEDQEVDTALIVWDESIEHLLKCCGDGMPEVATWLIPVDALELADGPVVDLPELDLSDDTRLHLARVTASAATRLAIAEQLRGRAAEIKAGPGESNTQRTVNARVARVLRGIADDVEAGKVVTRG